MSASSFVLKHGEIALEHTIGLTPGLPALVYGDGNSAT
jgi:hypothetical protein